MGKWWSSSASDRRIVRAAFAVALLVLVTSCGRDRGPSADSVVPAATDEGTPSGTLPTPEAAPGASLTGMPTQPPPPPAVDETPPPQPVDETAPTDATAVAPVDPATADPNAAPATTDPSATPAAGPPPSVAPTSADLAAAAGVVTQYMASVSAGAFAKAQGLWSTTPNDSGVLQLARGTGFDVSIGAAAADATGRISVPVDLRGTADDGSVRHVQASYAVQRTPTGTWRILGATVRDVAP